MLLGHMLLLCPHLAIISIPLTYQDSALSFSFLDSLSFPGDKSRVCGIFLIRSASLSLSLGCLRTATDLEVSWRVESNLA